MDQGHAGSAARRVHRQYPVPRDAELCEANPRDGRRLSTPVRHRAAHAQPPADRGLMTDPLELTSRAEATHFWFRGFREFVTPVISEISGGGGALSCVAGAH